jgi:hypothetical protein
MWKIAVDPTFGKFAFASRTVFLTSTNPRWGPDPPITGHFSLCMVATGSRTARHHFLSF